MQHKVLIAQTRLGRLRHLQRQIADNILRLHHIRRVAVVLQLQLLHIDGQNRALAPVLETALQRPLLRVRLVAEQRDERAREHVAPAQMPGYGVGE